MQLIINTPEKIVIRVLANEPLFNALRRSIHEINTLAVDEVEFFKNDSALYDEMLALRIGLVPLVTEKKMNAKTEVELKLVKKGPGIVYSGDLKGSADVVHKNIPLVLLENEQEIELVATARLGKGIDHAKYIPGLGYYRHLVQISSKDAKIESLVHSAKGYLKAEKNKEGFLCDLPEGVVEEISRIDKEAINETDEIIFVIESYGVMSASEILVNSIHALGENLAEFEEALK
ncbi:MAG: DNA-directed RNA polymerase subunit D [Nanoarchaeota archaeon]